MRYYFIISGDPIPEPAHPDPIPNNSEEKVASSGIYMYIPTNISYFIDTIMIRQNLSIVCSSSFYFILHDVISHNDEGNLQ